MSACSSIESPKSVPPFAATPNEHAVRMYATLSAINRRLIRPTSRIALCQSICDTVIDPGGFCGVWVGAQNAAGTAVTILADAGLRPPPEIRVGPEADDDDSKRLTDVITTRRPAICQDLARQTGTGSALHADCGARSCAAFPFRPAHEQPMVLAVYSPEPDYFTPETVGLLTQLAADLEYGIEAIDERERREAAEAALASEINRYRALLDVSVDGVHIITLDGELLDANDTFLRQLGYARAEANGLAVWNWNSELSRPEATMRLAQLGRNPVRIETRHRRKDGSTFDVEVVMVAVELHGRRAVCASARDITERKDFEKRFLRAQRLESVGLIASGIAHDLNNVLTPILLSTGLLELRYPAAADRALLAAIEAAARRGSNVVQQILTFARGADGQRVCVEPKVLLNELSHLIRETFPRNIHHRLEIGPDARPLRGDPTQLHQVFLNLAVNARDAMPEGGTLVIAVSNQEVDQNMARRIPSARPGRYVCISVSDTGTGMTAEVLDHLFEPFFTTKPRGRGTGLGLSTVHGLVRSHGGFIEVTSRPQQGSQFRVHLPAATRSAAPTVTLPAPRARLGHGEHVLIVDDEPAIVSIAASVLERHGFVALTAADGEEALTQFERHRGRVAVVITDVMMPRSDGVKVAMEVRSRWPGVPVIAMSGIVSSGTDDDNRQRLRAAGVTRILDKPCSESELLQAIEEELRDHAAAIAEPYETY
jgi:PAS domain S-box-containing protein